MWLSFRSQYDSFSPNVRFPMMDFELRVFKLGGFVDRWALRLPTQGRLRICMKKCLTKINRLARLVEATNDEIQKQEDWNMKWRYKVDGLE